MPFGSDGETKSVPEPADQTMKIGVPVERSFASGRYVTRRILGEGGQKVVYLVHDEALDRECALSMVKSELLDAEDLARLRREAQAMARLGAHSNIVTVHDFGEEDGRPYLVCEYVPGGDLRQELRNASGSLPLERALAIAADVARALAIAHARGVIHRDVKPANVWLCDDGSAKLGDFGLAFSLDRSRLTMAGMVMGTAAYMSPEQALGAPVTERSDLYSLGALLYEMVCGRRPFTDENVTALIAQHINARPEAPSQHNRSLPPALDALILRLLAKSPQERPPSAAAVGEELRRIAAGAAASTQPETATVTPPPELRPVTARPRRRALLIGGAALAVAAGAALAAAIAFVLAGGTPNQSSPTTTSPAGSSKPADSLATIGATLPEGGSLYINLQTSESAGFGKLGQLPSASSIKALIALEVERQVEAGLLNWDQSLVVRDSDIVGGTGVLQSQAGRQLTLRELLDTTLDYSDNTGGNMLVRLLGGFAPVNQLAGSLGLSDTRMERYFEDLAARDRGLDNYTSASDLAHLFVLLHQGTAVSAAGSQDILTKLQHRLQVYPSWSEKLLPPETVKASINGLLPDERIEVSLLELGGGREGVLAVVLTGQPAAAAAEEAISSLARDVYQVVSR